jgi:type I restriction enzyme, S subunit
MKNELLKNLCKIIGGNPAPNEFPNIEEGVPFIKMKDLGRYHLTNNLVEIENIIELNNKFKLIKKGSVLLPRSGSVGLNHRAILGKDSYMVSHICALEVLDENLLCNGFLYYYLTTVDMKRFLKKTTGLDAITFESLGKIQIPLPPLPEQKRIATILDKADALRQKNNQLLAAYDELLQATFLDMFGDPVTNPKHFPVGKIMDLVNTVNYGTSSKSEDNGEYPYLRMNNITYSGEMDFSGLKYINLSENDKDKYLVKKGDLLFNRTNSKDLVGKTAVYRDSRKMAIAGYIIRIRVKKNANSEYISGFLNSTYGKKILKGLCKSIVGMANINAQELQRIKILIPPVTLQNQFAQIVENIEAQKAILKQSIKESEDLFNGLVQEAFNGELS